MRAAAAARTHANGTSFVEGRTPTARVLVGKVMEGFLSEAAQDEARLARIFAHCDADGDGVLSRAE